MLAAIEQEDVLITIQLRIIISIFSIFSPWHQWLQWQELEEGVRWLLDDGCFTTETGSERDHLTRYNSRMGQYL